MSMPFPEQAPRPPLFPKFSSVFGKVDAGRKFALGFLAAMAGVSLLAMLLMSCAEWWATWAFAEGIRDLSRALLATLCDTVVLLICLFNLRNRTRSLRLMLLAGAVLLCSLWPLASLVVRAMLGHAHLPGADWRYLFLSPVVHVGLPLLHLGSMLAIRRLPWLRHEGSLPGGEQEMPPAESPAAGEMR